MTSNRARRAAMIASLLLVAACGGGGDDGGGEVDGDAAPAETTAAASEAGPSSSEPDTPSEPAPGPDPTEAASTDRACGLLDEAFLAETFAGQEGTFGDPYQFGSGAGSADGLVSTWDDASTGLSLRLTLEDAATAETDDHSDRAYNIDVDPVVEPQDGPGEKAVLLIDQATGDLGGAAFPYGYFFVSGDVTVFIETVGLDIGADNLRTLADEAAARNAEG